MHRQLEALTKGWTTPHAHALISGVAAVPSERPLVRPSSRSLLSWLLDALRRPARRHRRHWSLGRLDAKTLKDIGLTRDLRTPPRSPASLIMDTRS